MPQALRFLGWPLLVGVLFALLLIQRYPEWVGLPRQEVQLVQAPLYSRLQEGPVSYSKAVDTASPAVANLYTTKLVSKPAHPLFEDPTFRRFFSDNLPRQQRMESSLGSAVLMSREGYLLTNNHVVSGADQIIVALNIAAVSEAGAQAVWLRAPSSKVGKRTALPCGRALHVGSGGL